MRHCFFLLLASLAPWAACAAIYETAHFQEIERYADPNTLILLDIDDTLIVPVQMLGCDEWFMDRIQQHQEYGKPEEEAFEKALAEWEAVRHLTQMEIVEPGSEEIVHSLQQKGYSVMGLTSQGLALATRTFQQLKQNRIDLTLSAPNMEGHYLTQNQHGVLFRSGILFTSGTHKGKALFGLCDQIGYAPQRILFINDKISHLRSVEETAEERGVEFIGLRYSYSDARKAAYCRGIASFQFEHSTFVHLLTDEEAQTMMGQR